MLKQAADKIGLKINREKTKTMKLLDIKDSTDDADVDEDVDFVKVNKFHYLGVMLNKILKYSKYIFKLVILVQTMS